MSGGIDDGPHTGLVIASHGAHAHVESNGRIYWCTLRKKTGIVACGDRVLLTLNNDDTAVIIGIEPRRNALHRQINTNKSKILAVNIDLLLITLEAPIDMASVLLDTLDTLNLDRYLVAAENAHITPAILINKIDRLDPLQQQQLRTSLELYAVIGYDIVLVSTRDGNGLQRLRPLLRDKTSAIVGQSGVGKSSLVNSLIPGVNTRTADLSRVTDQGRHTTTVATLYPIDTGGELIDSPGVREFQLSLTDTHQLAWGFREFRPFLGQCRFNDCRHGDEPGCAIHHATATGAIHSMRLANYQRLLHNTTHPSDWDRTKTETRRRQNRQRDE